MDFCEPQLKQTGKNSKAETLHLTQNLLLHLPGHFTSEIFYSLSFLETQQMGIWPFSSFFPLQYSWSLQPSAKQDFKPDSGAKTLRRAASWPQLQNTVLSLDISLHFSVLLSLPQAVTYFDRLQSLETDKADALCTYSLADIFWWCHSSSQAKFLTILLLMPTECQSWPLTVGFYCLCSKGFIPSGCCIHPVVIQSYELLFTTTLPSDLSTNLHFLDRKP